MDIAGNQRKVGAILSYVSIALHNVIGILYTPFMLRSLGQTEYGLYALVASVISYLTILDLGFGNTIIRYAAKYRVENQTHRLAGLFGLFLKIHLFIGFIALVGGGFLYFFADKMFTQNMSAEELQKIRVMLLLMTFNVAASFPLGIFSSICSAYEKFVFPRVLNIIQIVIVPCIMIPLLLTGYRAVAMTVVVTVFNLAVLCANAFYCFGRLKIRISFDKVPRDLILEILGYSMFIFLGGIIDQIYWNTGQFVLGITSGAVAVAVFSVGMNFRGYFFSFSTAISGVMLPKITSMITQKQSNRELSDIFIRIGRIQYLLLSFILSGFIIFGKTFIKLWAGPDYEDSFYIALIILVPVIVPLIQNTGILILQAKNQQKFRTYLYLAIALLSLCVSIPLARLYGGIGCAIGISSALILGNVVIINIYYKRVIKLDIPRFWKEIGLISVPVLPLMCFGYLLNATFREEDVWTLLMKIVIYSCVFILVIGRWGMNSYERGLVIGPLRNFFAVK